MFNPETKTWSTARVMTIKRGYQSQLTLSSGNVFVLGGSWNGGLGGKDGEVYNITSGVWSVKRGIPCNGTLLTEDEGGMVKMDNHMWLFEGEDGRVFHAGPSKHMHWLDLAGNGSIEYAGYVSSRMSRIRV
jgi:galactose oxidase